MTSTRSSIMSSFTPTSLPVVVSTTRKTIPAVANGYEWWSGNAHSPASVKVEMEITRASEGRVLDTYTIKVNGRDKADKWRKLPRPYPNGDIIIKDYRGIIKEVSNGSPRAIAEGLYQDTNKPIHTIYHERNAVIPAYDEVYSLMEEEGWNDAWVYYYGAVASTRPAVREDGEIERFNTSCVVSVSYTRSALTPTRAVVLIDDSKEAYCRSDPLGFISYGERTDFVVDGKVVHQAQSGRLMDDYRFRNDWKANCPIRKARCCWRWSEMVSPMKKEKVHSSYHLRLLHGGVLMSEISSKNITDTAMNPFGEGSIAKNRKALADGLWYITDTPESVPDFALGKARQNFLFKKELMEAVLHPDRVAKMVEKYGIEWVD